MNGHKKRIAVIGLKGLPAFGGAAAVGENLLKELAADYEFTVYSVASHTDLKTGTYNGYRQIVFRKARLRKTNTFAYFVKSTLHVLFGKRYDLVHIHHASSGFVVPFLRLRCKVVVTFHGIHRAADPKFGRLTNRLIVLSQRLNLRFANRVISVSKPDTDYLNADSGNTVTYIPNGVFTPPGRGTSPVSGPYNVFAANRVYEIKGLHLVLEAMHLRKDTGTLLVIGDLEHQPAYKEKIIGLAEGLNVQFTGLIRDKEVLFDYIRGAEVFLFPSLTEAMSMMLLEVASLGVPVIASDIEANRAVFPPDEAFFFTSGDARSLAEQLERSASQPELREQVAAKALARVQQFHQWPVIAESYREVFTAVMRS